LNGGYYAYPPQPVYAYPQPVNSHDIEEPLDEDDRNQLEIDQVLLQ
jgi:hypothetical protein